MRICVFRKAVFAHHADEEKVLFPSVIDSALPGEERRAAQSAVKLLTAQHRNLDALGLSLHLHHTPMPISHI